MYEDYEPALDGPLRATDVWSDFGIERAVANEANTVIFFPADAVDRLVEHFELRESAGEFPANGAQLERRAESGDPVLAVTSEYEASGWIRTKTKTAEHKVDLRVLHEVVERLPAGSDPLLSARTWVPTAESAPFFFEFDRSPPELVALVETGDARNAVDGDVDLERPCCCGITPRIEV